MQVVNSSLSAEIIDLAWACAVKVLKVVPRQMIADQEQSLVITGLTQQFVQLEAVLGHLMKVPRCHDRGNPAVRLRTCGERHLNAMQLSSLIQPAQERSGVPSVAIDTHVIRAE